jgi:hypothetical protein
MRKPKTDKPLFSKMYQKVTGMGSPEPEDKEKTKKSKFLSAFKKAGR